MWNSEGVGGQERSEEETSGDSVEVVVLWGVSLSLEHVEHSLGDEETTSDVDGADEDGAGGECLGDGVGEETTSEAEETTGGGETGDGVGDTHEWSVEGGGDGPDGLVPSDGGESEGGDHSEEDWVRAEDSESDEGGESDSGEDGVLEGGGEGVLLGEGLFFLLGVLLGLLGGVELGEWFWAGPELGSGAGEDGSLDDLVLHVDGEVVLLVSHGLEELGDVVGVEGGGLSGETGGEIGVADDLDSVDLDDLTGLGEGDVSAGLGSEVDDDGTLLHGLDHLFGDDEGGLLSGDEGSRNDDIDVLGLLLEELSLGLEVLLGDFLGESSLFLDSSLDIDGDELGSHGLDLFLGGGSGISSANDGSETLGGLDGGETGDSGSDDEDLGGWGSSGGGDQSGEESAEVVGGLDDGLISGDVGHTGEGVEDLGSGDSGNLVHGEGGESVLGGLVVDLGILGWVEEGDGGGSLLHGIKLVLSEFGVVLGGSDLEDDILLVGRLSIDDFASDAGILSISNLGLITGSLFDSDLISILDDLGGSIWGQGDSLFTWENFLWNSDIEILSWGNDGESVKGRLSQKLILINSFLELK